LPWKEKNDKIQVWGRASLVALLQGRVEVCHSVEIGVKGVKDDGVAVCCFKRRIVVILQVHQADSPCGFDNSALARRHGGGVDFIPAFCHIQTSSICSCGCQALTSHQDLKETVGKNTALHRLYKMGFKVCFIVAIAMLNTVEGNGGLACQGSKRDAAATAGVVVAGIERREELNLRQEIICLRSYTEAHGVAARVAKGHEELVLLESIAMGWMKKEDEKGRDVWGKVLPPHAGGMRTVDFDGCECCSWAHLTLSL
jgi:hypothetical protein